MNMDQELREALQRKPAPPDLADRVLARINNGEATTTASNRGPGSNGVLRWLAAAAVLALTAGGAGRYYTQQQEAAEAARVQQELRIALQITNDTLAIVQSKLSQPATKGGR